MRLDQITGAARGHQVGRVLLALARAGHDEVHGHDEGVFENGHAVQTAIAAAKTVALQNALALFRSQWLGPASQAGNAASSRHRHLQDRYIMRPPAGERKALNPPRGRAATIMRWFALYGVRLRCC